MSSREEPQGSRHTSAKNGGGGGLHQSASISEGGAAVEGSGSSGGQGQKGKASQRDCVGVDLSLHRSFPSRYSSQLRPSLTSTPRRTWMMPWQPSSRVPSLSMRPATRHSRPGQDDQRGGSRLQGRQALNLDTWMTQAILMGKPPRTIK